MLLCLTEEHLLKTFSQKHSFKCRWTLDSNPLPEKQEGFEYPGSTILSWAIKRKDYCTAELQILFISSRRRPANRVEKRKKEPGTEQELCVDKSYWLHSWHAPCLFTCFLQDTESHPD
ncbi:unnamed protein product [Gadus morhua 'NCC']